MTDIPAIPETPRVLSPRDEARVRFALQAEGLSKTALNLLPIDPDAPRGQRLRRTLALKKELDELVQRAVNAEREEGTTWAQLADATGISKQAAHERWAGNVTAWAANGRTMFPPDSRHSALEVACRLDQVYADLDSRHSQDAVSSGLDAVRFPGAAAAEAARRERAQGLHTRLALLDEQLTTAYAEWKLLNDAGARQGARVEALHRLSALNEEIAALYEELTGAEPELADEHRNSAERARSSSTSNREYAELLAAKAEAAPANTSSEGTR